MSKESTAVKHSEGHATFFVETLSREADLVFRLFYAFTFDSDLAQERVRLVFESLVADITTLMDKTSDAIRFHVLSLAWDLVKTIEVKSKDNKKGLDGLLLSLDRDGRAVLLFIDAFGLTVDEVGKILDCDHETLRKNLADARKKMIKYAN